MIFRQHPGSPPLAQFLFDFRPGYLLSAESVGIHDAGAEFGQQSGDGRLARPHATGEADHGLAMTDVVALLLRQRVSDGGLRASRKRRCE